MALPPEVQNWLNNALTTAKATGVPDEKLAVITEVFSQEKVADFAKQSVHAASDYSRKMDALRQQETLLTNYEGRLGVWKEDLEKRLTTAEQRAQLADEYAAKLKTAQTELARLNQEGSTNFNVDSISVKTPVNNNGTPPVGGTITKDQLRKEMEAYLAEISPQYAMLPAIVNDLTHEHQRLFGELPVMQPLIDKAIKLGQPLVTVWENEYKVSDRRANLAKELEDKRVNERVEAQLNKERSNLSIQGQSFRSGDPRSPVLTLAAKAVTPTPSENAPTNPTPIFNAVQSEGVKDAMEAYNKGTYQVKYPGQS